MSLLKDIEPIKTRDYLKTKFQEYYQEAEITLPPRFTSREWGFLDWDGRAMRRHVKFTSLNEVKKYYEINKWKYTGDIQKDYYGLLYPLKPNFEKIKYLDIGLWYEKTELKFYKQINKNYV